MKKGQTLLVFFAQNLVSIILFLIVLISIMIMVRNVQFTVQQFNEQTAFYLVSRRILNSADCLAYNKRTTLYHDGQILTSSRIYPNVVDEYKIYDFEHINCMRNDDYERIVDFSGRNSVWDGSEGTGAGLKYDIIIVDLSGDEPVYLTQVPTLNHNDEEVPIVDIIYTMAVEEGEEPEYEFKGGEFLDYSLVTSLLGRINKKIIPCEDQTSSEFIYHDSSSPCPPNAKCDLFPSGYEGSRIVPHSGICIDEGEAKYLARWKIFEPSYTFGKTTVSFPEYYHLMPGLGTYQQSFNCFNAQNTKRSIIPITIYKDGEMKPGIALIQTCLLVGREHGGLVTEMAAGGFADE